MLAALLELILSYHIMDTSYSLNSSKGGYTGDYIGEYYAGY